MYNIKLMIAVAMLAVPGMLLAQSVSTTSMSQGGGAGVIMERNPDAPPVSKTQYVENLQRLVAYASSYADGLRVMTIRYTDFLEGVADLNAGCNVDKDMLAIQQASGNYAWVYRGAEASCNNEVATLKEAARNTGIRIDAAEKILRELQVAAAYATTQLERESAINAAEQMKGSLEKSEVILDELESEIERLKPGG